MEIFIGVLGWAIFRFLFQQYCLNRISGQMKIAALVALIIGIFLISYFAGQYYSGEAERELDKFDTNGDGIFSPNEMTTGYREAMDRVTNDTGQFFGPVFLFIFLLIFEFAFALVYPLTVRFFRRQK